MPRAFSDQERKMIINRLLEAGHRQFSTFGLKKTSVRELAGAAGISKGAFYLFFDSKESLLLEVVEQAEEKFRVEVLAVIEQPGPSPRKRLLAVFKKAFTLWKTIPIFGIVLQEDYRLLFRRVPPEKLQEHVLNDQQFIEEMVSRCRQTNIPIQVPVEEISGLMYAAVFASMHESDLGPGRLTGAMDLMLELIAAYCLGEVTILPEGQSE